MHSNFIALVPSLKFTPGPAFLLTCDAMGVQWLRDRFLWLVDAKSDPSFVIGNGIPIESDSRCILTVTKVQGNRSSEIQWRDQTHFTWRIDAEEAEWIAEKLFPLATSGVPGHQYIDLNGGQFRTVEVSKDEYPVDTIRRMRDDQN
jgi:hypothetical protein